ncbi:hypothetical protein C2845_PM01G19070 [Panicum miliaceum]|uniref:Uncharacterized protein n=1 Tax=Panicum miliaceum TaxID=4540 RepID=A0A3L6TNM9_PANMI|nr:hypothetical protein C2845_PM01G19070 [Panicum miliaceum]
MIKVYWAVISKPIRFVSGGWPPAPRHYKYKVVAINLNTSEKRFPHFLNPSHVSLIAEGAGGVWKTKRSRAVSLASGRPSLPCSHIYTDKYAYFLYGSSVINTGSSANAGIMIYPSISALRD